MRKKLLVTFGILFFSIALKAQSVNEIKSEPGLYLWGEGIGSTIRSADKEALSMLISQITVHVESEFSLIKKEMAEGNKSEISEACKSMVNTYSDATLHNTERLVISNEPDAKVFRYIRREEIAKVFKERVFKIHGFVQNGDKALSKHQVADALRYYYWAYTLLKSHPKGDTIHVCQLNGEKALLASWLPLQLNTIFSDIEIGIQKTNKFESYISYDLLITHKGEKVENFDYSFFDGRDWSNIISARDGLGQIELNGVAADAEKIDLKAEYIFEGEAVMDLELKNVLEKLDPLPFRQSYFKLNLKNQEKVIELPIVKEDSIAVTQVTDAVSYEESISEVMESIKNRTYTNVDHLFTESGMQTFNQLVAYGKAKLIGTPDLRFIKFEDQVICRSIPMLFSFETNNKQFVEDVVFHFNSEQKIEGLSFSLSENALKSILNNKAWDEKERLILVNFLEHYKTAYALKRLDYIESIFADDALIITGKIVKVKSSVENNYLDHEIVRYNRQSKQKYIKNLRHSFSSKEYINIRFEDSKIRKAGKGGDIFGVQIVQNYTSNNYGDKGYLFLMVDLNNADEPTIHVRTWQPEVGVNDSIFDLGDFN